MTWEAAAVANKLQQCRPTNKNVPNKNKRLTFATKLIITYEIYEARFAGLEKIENI